MTNKEIIALALAKGIAEVEIFSQTSQSLSISLQDGELENANTGKQFGMSIRGLYNDKMGYVYLESTDQTTVEEAIGSLIQNAKMVTKTEKEIIYGEKNEYQVVNYSAADFNNYKNNHKIAMLQEINQKILAKDPRIVKIGHLQYQESAIKTSIVNSKGLDLTREFSYLVAVAQIVALENDQTTMGFAYEYGNKFNEINIDKIVDEAVEKAISSLGAGSLETKMYPVVLTNEVASDILQAFTSVFYGESAIKKLTILAGKEGEKVFGDNISIIDNPFDENALVKSPFDDEGVPCYQKYVVENGIFKGLLHNLSTADYFKTKSTGNGFKQGGVASPIAVSETNLSVVTGTLSEQEIIKTVEKGVLINSVQGLHSGVNQISGDFSVQASGFEILNGQKGRPVTLIVLSGNFYEMFNNIELIGNNLSKNYLGVAAPTLKVKAMSISGK